MAQDASEITVAADGDLSVAPFGTALPSSIDTALNAAFSSVGYLSEDGMSFTVGAEEEEINVWQKATPARRIVTARTFQASGELLQWNRATFALAFGGGEWSSPAGGVYRYDPPADRDAITEYSAVLDWEDGDRKSRIVIYRCTLADEVESSLTRTDAAALPITLNALTPDEEDRSWYYLSDDAAYAAS